MHGVTSLFQRLESEHRSLSEALDVFERYLARAVAGTGDLFDLPRFAVFFRDFVHLHHEREERILLPALARREFSLERGPLRHIREEHLRENVLLDELFAIVFRRGGCTPDDPALIAAAQAFIQFERSHIAKETHHLYPAAKTALVNDTGRLDDEVARFDGDRAAYSCIAWTERVLGELSATYPLPS